MSKLFENEAREILTHGDIEEIRRGLIARMEKASLEYLQEDYRTSRTEVK